MMMYVVSHCSVTTRPNTYSEQNDKFTTDFNSFDLNGNYQYTVKTPRQKTKARIFDDVDKTRHISPDYPVMSSLSG